jgi:hypothetical protein
MYLCAPSGRGQHLALEPEVSPLATFSLRLRRREEFSNCFSRKNKIPETIILSLNEPAYLSKVFTRGDAKFFTKAMLDV